jgi:hypothetical protein
VALDRTVDPALRLVSGGRFGHGTGSRCASTPELSFATLRLYMMRVHFALLGHDGEERLRIRLVAAGEQALGVLPAPAAAPSAMGRRFRGEQAVQ